MTISLRRENIEFSANYLSRVLATTYILYLKTQNYHWNVESPSFYGLHKLFEMQYDEMQEAIDEIAERIRKIDRFAPASTIEFQKLSCISEGPMPKTSKEMLETLLEDQEKLIDLLRKGIKSIEDNSDEGTKDLFIQRLRAHEKMAWMSRSSLK